jgi:hypothetical protein
LSITELCIMLILLIFILSNCVLWVADNKYLYLTWLTCTGINTAIGRSGGCTCYRVTERNMQNYLSNMQVLDSQHLTTL